MAAPRPAIYTVAAHGGFADALAQGLLDRFGDDPLELARGVVLLPNNRAVRAVQEAFVRLSGKGLLLPRLVALGDPALDEEVGMLLETAAGTEAIAPAIRPLARQFALTGIVKTLWEAEGRPIATPQALQLAREFGRTLDELLVEEKTLADLLELDVDAELQSHWQDSLRLFGAAMEQWQSRLKSDGLIEGVERRNRMFDTIGAQWTDDPPPHFIAAAGINSTAPAIARLMKRVAFLPRGMVVLANLDRAMPDEDWRSLDGSGDDSGLAAQGEETHPQYHLKVLLDRMDIARDEVMRWNRIGPSAALAQRTKTLSHAFAIAEQTGRWASLESRERSLSGLSVVVASDSAREARAIALLVRQALAEPEQRIAVVTPDRALARRVSAQLERWGIAVDDSAGTPLSITPPGVLTRLLLAAWQSGFAPAELLALLKHPLVDPLDDRLAWLEGVRDLDIALRGPRPAPGLATIDALLAKNDGAEWWQGFCDIIDPFATGFGQSDDWTIQLQMLIDTLAALTGGHIWQGPAGRELSALFDTLLMAEAPPQPTAEEWPAFIDLMMAEQAVRPPYGGHPRVQLFGLLEARLQQADLVICAGLNEGSWPQAHTPDPWLAPMVRRRLGLAAQERQVGLSAHDLMTAMGAKRVVLTRAHRDASGPAIASRFFLRLQALSGDNLRHEDEILALADQLDAAKEDPAYPRPMPDPEPEQRRISSMAVTHVDTLTSDPYAFYAKKILGLASLDKVDAEPTAAWRGTAVHDVLEKWAKEDGFAPDRLMERAHDLLHQPSTHPAVRAMWGPRLLEALAWIGEEVQALVAQGREPVLAEEWGRAELFTVPLKGKIDRLDRDRDGGLVIVDYKTGKAPTNKQVASGHALQLGLLGAIAEQGGFEDVSGSASGFEYWSLAKGYDGSFGHVDSPTKGRANVVAAEDMVDHALSHFKEAVDAYILGRTPFVAKLVPEFAYADYDQLMRLEEWYGRVAPDGEGGDG